MVVYLQMWFFLSTYLVRGWNKERNQFYLIIYYFHLYNNIRLEYIPILFVFNLILFKPLYIYTL